MIANAGPLQWRVSTADTDFWAFSCLKILTISAEVLVDRFLIAFWCGALADVQMRA